MKVLVIGSGGREHAIAWKLAKSKGIKVYIAPGNPGTAAHGVNVPIPAEDIDGLKAFAKSENIDLTIVGPELPLTLGVCDAFDAAGLKIFGPSKRAAILEGSKVFCKELLKKYSIPTAYFKKFDKADAATAYIENHNPPFVVKADGLAAGKGVIICRTREEAQAAAVFMIEKEAFGKAGHTIVIEEFLEGEEASFLAITDGITVVPLAPAQDHKAAYDNDEGPNTGGMGAYSPAPVVTPELQEEIMSTIMVPVVKAMAEEGRPYKGVLYAGLMIKDGRPKVLEFNCRFGDPETQPILMRLEEDLAGLLLSVAEDRLHSAPLKWSDKPAVCVVMASGGYPGKYEYGKVIRGLDEAGKVPGVVVFHAGTAEKDGNIVTVGGRVLGVTASGADLKETIRLAYEALGRISWEGAFYRKDIGRKALNRV